MGMTVDQAGNGHPAPRLDHLARPVGQRRQFGADAPLEPVRRLRAQPQTRRGSSGVYWIEVRGLEQHRETRIWQRHQDRAFSLLSSAATTSAFDLTREPEELRERYGQTINGMGLLLARRLVEAKVPFVTLYWMPDRARAKRLKCASAGGWDTHGNNFQCLREMLLPEFDRCFSALLEDLVDRGLLDSTLVLVTSEMGRKPKIGDPRSGGVSGAGRDHWTYCLTDLLAGGGIQGGQTYGASDKHGGSPADRRVTPSDIARTVYHTMGIHDLSATDSQDRPYNLQEDGRPLLELL